MLRKFRDARQALYDHVGFVEDWVVFPIDDATGMYWTIVHGDCVRLAETREQLDSDGDYYEYAIYTQRFYDKWVYRGEKLTMIFVDTHCDGNIFFSFFSNDKEVK
ncbi:MAG: hypothetical protein WC343_05330 [Bacilli bacterium]|jgi:hypothetical protein